MDAPSVDRDAGCDPAQTLLPTGALGDERRARAQLSAAVTLYAAALAGLHAAGLLDALWKTAAVPALFVLAYLLRRFSAFVREFAVFLCAVVMFDNTRGLVYGVTQHFQRPVYMGYALALERTLFGTPIPSAWLQRVMSDRGQVSAFQKALVVLHASHFLVFLLFGMLLWLKRPRACDRYKLAMVIVMGVGIACYALVPTVPPWMASTRFLALEPVMHVPEQVYQVTVPKLTASFDLNPIAAMPSLHAAFPTLLTLICFECFGAWGFLMGAYTLAMWFTIIALGEHYVVDVMAGVTLALIAFTCAHRVPFFTRWFDARRARVVPRPAVESPWQGVRRLHRPLLAAFALLVLAQLADSTAHALHGRDWANDAFVARELRGKTPAADYYLGLNAYRAGDYARAERYLRRALDEVPDPQLHARAAQLLQSLAAAPR